MESSSSQPARRGRGRPPKEKAPKPPPRPRGRPRKRSKEQDMPPPPPPAAAAAAPPAADPRVVRTLDSTLANIKALKDLSLNFKKSVQDFNSSVPSLLDQPRQMLADLCDAHVREKEYHAMVQNAVQDFHEMKEALEKGGMLD